MSLSNILSPNKNDLYCDELFCNQVNVNNGTITSFATNSVTTSATGLSNFAYNLYCHVIGKYMICYFDSPPVSLSNGLFSFRVAYPLNFRPPSGNINDTTAFGHGIIQGSSDIGTISITSSDVGQQYVTCNGLTNSPSGFSKIRGSFIVNLN